MSSLHSLLVYVHIAAGAAGLLLFSIPAAARKGGRMHVAAGRWYARIMYVVAATAVAASLLVLVDPLGVRHPGEAVQAAQGQALAASYRNFSWFLLMLSVLVFASLRHGLAALGERSVPGTLARPVHRATIALLGALGAWVAVLGIAERAVLLLVFAAIAMPASLGMMRETFLDNPSRSRLVDIHLNGLIGSGIGAWTAFFALGGSRLLGDVLPGQWQTLVWITPAVIGTFAISLTRRRLRRARPSAAGLRRAAAAFPRPGTASGGNATAPPRGET